MRGATNVAKVRPEMMVTQGTSRPSDLVKDAFVVPEYFEHRFLMTS